MFLKLEHPFPFHPAEIGVTSPRNVEFAPMGFVKNATQVFGQFLIRGLDDKLVIVTDLTNNSLKRVFLKSFVLFVFKNPLDFLFMLPQIAAA